MSHDRIAGIGALVLGAALYTLAGDSESYLFPRNIALGIGALGLAIVAAAVIGMRPPTTVTGGTGRTWLKVLPALAVFVAYALTMESIGFYASAFAAFLIIVWIYSREPVSPGVAARRLGIAAAFVAAIFLLFSVLLNVQTPRGLLL